MVKEAILHIIDEMNTSTEFDGEKFARIARLLNALSLEFEIDLNVQLTLNAVQNGLNITYTESGINDRSDKFDIIVLRDMLASFGMENNIIGILNIEVPGEKGQGTATREFIKYCEQRTEDLIVVTNHVDVNDEFLAASMEGDGQLAAATLLKQSKFLRRIGFTSISEYIGKYIVNPDFAERFQHELESEVLVYMNKVGSTVLDNLKKLSNKIPTPVEVADNIEVIQAELVES